MPTLFFSMFIITPFSTRYGEPGDKLPPYTDNYTMYLLMRVVRDADMTSYMFVCQRDSVYSHVHKQQGLGRSFTMPVFKHILVPLDGSPFAERVLPFAAWLARTSAASISLVWSVPYVAPMSMSSVGATKVVDDGTQTHDTVLAGSRLQAVAAQNTFTNIHVNTAILVGEPVHALLTYIRQQEIDLVMMYSHDHTIVASWLLGNVTQGIVRHSPVPVFVIRDTMQLPEIPEAPHLP